MLLKITRRRSTVLRKNPMFHCLHAAGRISGKSRHVTDQQVNSHFGLSLCTRRARRSRPTNGNHCKTWCKTGRDGPLGRPSTKREAKMRIAGHGYKALDSRRPVWYAPNNSHFGRILLSAAGPAAPPYLFCAMFCGCFRGAIAPPRADPPVADKRAVCIGGGQNETYGKRME